MRRGEVLPIAQGVVVAVFAVFPAYLTGALAVSLRNELDFGSARLGLAVAWFFISSALSAVVLGNLVDRLGVRLSLSLGAAVSGVALTGIALAPGYGWLLTAMTIGGAGNAICQPAVNSSLSRRVAAGGLGLAIGVKQSSIPASTLLGGLAVPTLGVAIGWRPTFGIVAMAAFLAAAASWHMGDGGDGPVQPPAGSRRIRARDLPEMPSLAILSLAGLLGSAGTTSIGAFLVDAAVVGGMPVRSAGMLFAAASAFGLAARIFLGWFVDRRPSLSRYGLISVLLVLGAPGFVLLSSGQTAAYVLGAIVVFAAGWSWPGVYHYAVVSQHPSAPGSATGVLQTGASFGAGSGPLALGYIAEHYSYAAAWRTAAALSLLSAVAFLVGRAHLRRFQRLRGRDCVA